MKPRLLDLVVCPLCRGRLGLEAFLEAGSEGGAREIVEGALRCERCNGRYPIIRGVPRLLPPTLLSPMRRRYPGFFERHPDLMPPSAASEEDHQLAETLESFTRQRLDLRTPGPEFVGQWRAHLQRNLGEEISISALRDKLILDVGCGFGRHVYVAAQAGAEVVGVDLSGGVDVAAENVRAHSKAHIVQADILQSPLRFGVFDIVWAFGVIHHLPDPQKGFSTLVRFAKPNGGLVAIWVYGYRGMAFSYRLSHMRVLRQATVRVSPASRVRISKAVAAALSVAYWAPLNVLVKAGLGDQAKRLPLSEHIEQGWLARVAAVHDRLSTPITHYHERDELLQWYGAAGLTRVVVEDTERRGWRASGWRAAQMT